jgi:CBS domain-containing protein
MSLSVITADQPTERPPRPRATVAQVMRPASITAGDNDHAAAAVYLMKHARATALLVLDSRTGRLAGLITEADIAQAVADGKNLNDVRIRELMPAVPAVIPARTSIRDAAEVMLTTGHRQLPVTDDDGRAGIIDIADIIGGILRGSWPDLASVRQAGPAGPGTAVT